MPVHADKSMHPSKVSFAVIVVLTIIGIFGILTWQVTQDSVLLSAVQYISVNRHENQASPTESSDKGTLFSKWNITMQESIHQLQLKSGEINHHSNDVLQESTPSLSPRNNSKQLLHQYTSKVQMQQKPNSFLHMAFGSKSKPSSQQHLDHKPQRNRGYVLSLRYFDQVSCALRRMASLQCWAGHWGMPVVEPFVDTTKLSTAPPNPQISKNMRFQNLFNIIKWNAKSRSHSYSTLISWEGFLKNAPQSVILVEFIYMPESWQRPHNSSCTFKDLRKFWYHYLVQHNFKILRKVCFDFRIHKFVTAEEFNSHIFQRCPKHDCTVVFNEWRGIYSETEHHYCVPVEDEKCATTDLALEFLTPNYHILQQAKDYALKYLQGEYIGVMFRWEKLIHFSNKSGVECMNHTRDYLAKKTGLNTVFVTYDVGTYGSKGMKNPDKSIDYKRAYNETLWLLKSLYGNSMTMRKYEERFTTVSRTRHPAHIAVLQKTLAAKAKCLLLVGYGQFQHHALIMWKLFHPGSQCFKILHGC